MTTTVHEAPAEPHPLQTVHAALSQHAAVLARQLGGLDHHDKALTDAIAGIINSLAKMDAIMPSVVEAEAPMDDAEVAEILQTIDRRINDLAERRARDIFKHSKDAAGAAAAEADIPAERPAP